MAQWDYSAYIQNVKQQLSWKSFKKCTAQAILGDQNSPGRGNPNKVWAQTSEQGSHAFLLKNGPTEGNKQTNQQKNEAGGSAVPPSSFFSDLVVSPPHLHCYNFLPCSPFLFLVIYSYFSWHQHSKSDQSTSCDAYHSPKSCLADSAFKAQVSYEEQIYLCSDETYHCTCSSRASTQTLLSSLHMMAKPSFHYCWHTHTTLPYSPEQLEHSGGWWGGVHQPHTYPWQLYLRETNRPQCQLRWLQTCLHHLQGTGQDGSSCATTSRT